MQERSPKTSITERVPLGRAQVIAWKVLDELRPFCDRIEIAGSIRRRKETVKDVEILCIPKEGRTNLLDEPVGDALSDYLQTRLGQEWGLRLSVKGIATFGPANKLLRYDGFPVDVFTTTAANWGMALMVRTGPAEWNIRMMARLRALGMAGHAYGGITDTQGNEVICPTEDDVFKWLRWQPVAPEART